MIHAKNGGRRQALGRRFDLIPQEGLAAEAEIFHQGAVKYDEHNWKGLDFEGSETAPINHAFDHLAKATALPFGSAERRRQLAKVAANAHMQIWGEAQEVQHSLWDRLIGWISPKDSVGDQADGFADPEVEWTFDQEYFPPPQDSDDPGEPEPSVLDYEEPTLDVPAEGLRRLFATHRSTNSPEPQAEASTEADQLDR